jgi:hypothetical protein
LTSSFWIHLNTIESSVKKSNSPFRPRGVAIKRTTTRDLARYSPRTSRLPESVISLSTRLYLGTALAHSRLQPRSISAQSCTCRCTRNLTMASPRQIDFSTEPPENTGSADEMTDDAPVVNNSIKLSTFAQSTLRSEAEYLERPSPSEEAAELVLRYRRTDRSQASIQALEASAGSM